MQHAMFLYRTTPSEARRNTRTLWVWLSRTTPILSHCTKILVIMLNFHYKALPLRMRKKYIYNWFDSYHRKYLSNTLFKLILAIILMLITLIVHLIDTIIQKG